MTDIYTFVDSHYAFYRLSDISSYIADLLYKDKFFCDNIKNINNKRSCCGKGSLWVNKIIDIYRFECNF